MAWQLKFLDGIALIFYANVLIVLLGALLMMNHFFTAGTILSGSSVPLSLVFLFTKGKFQIAGRFLQ